MTKWAELDPRSLAVFRVILGGLLLVDTLWRLPYLTEFMTDDGVLPRVTLVSSAYSDYWLSLHLGSGNLAGQLVLSLLSCLLALGVILGWRTNWMVFGSWVMLNSLHARNPFINDRGDLQLSLMLFWAVFLPLGSCWSLDQRQGRKSFGSFRGVAPAGLILQFVWIYLFAGLLKTGDFWLARGDGLKFSLLSPMFATELATWLSTSSEGVLRLLNYGVIVGELVVAFLLLSPTVVNLTRSVAIGLLLFFHLNVLVLFKLGLFPIIGALCPLALIPKEWWQRFQVGEQAPNNQPTPKPLRLVLAFCILLCLFSNLNNRPGSSLERPDWLKALTHRLKLEQHWELFAPLPPINGHFRLVSLDSGQERVIFEGPPSPEKSEFQEFPSHRWKMLMLSSIYPEFNLVKEGTARALAKRNGSSNGKLRYYFVLKPISQKGEFQRPVIQNLWSEP